MEWDADTMSIAAGAAAAEDGSSTSSTSTSSCSMSHPFSSPSSSVYVLILRPLSSSPKVLGSLTNTRAPSRPRNLLLRLLGRRPRGLEQLEQRQRAVGWGGQSAWWGKGQEGACDGFPVLKRKVRGKGHGALEMGPLIGF